MDADLPHRQNLTHPCCVIACMDIGEVGVPLWRMGISGNNMCPVGLYTWLPVCFLMGHCFVLLNSIDVPNVQTSLFLAVRICGEQP